VLTDPAAAVLIALDADGEPLGYAHLRTHYSVWMAGPESFLEDLFVEEARRDGGIGRRLLREAAAWSRARGCRRLRLDTNERNERGIHLYEAEGFTCRRDSYDGGRQLYYTLDLDSVSGA
jgi:GNAT superfamily N-acetyltransferase